MLPLQIWVDLRSHGNEGVLRIPQSSSIIGVPPSDCLISYPGHSLGSASYSSAEIRSSELEDVADLFVFENVCRRTISNDSRRINNKIFISRANLIERIREFHAIVRVYYGEEVLSRSWRVFYEWKFVEDLRQSMVPCVVRHEVCWDVCEACWDLCVFLVVFVEAETMSFDLATRFIMLLWSRQQATILESKECNPFSWILLLLLLEIPSGENLSLLTWSESAFSRKTFWR